MIKLAEWVVTALVIVLVLLAIGYLQMLWSDYQCGPDAELVRLFPRKLCVPR